MQYDIDTLYPVEGQAIPTTGEEGGNTYWAWAVDDYAYFSKLIPDGFGTGGALKLTFLEASPSSSKNHKWKITVSLYPVTPAGSEYEEAFTQEFVCDATANTQTTRTLTIHTNGTIDGKYYKAGDELVITIQRDDADSNEDSNRVKIFEIVMVFAGLEGSTGGVPGRLGNIVAEVYERLNDVGINGIPVYVVIRQCNAVLDDLADAGLFKKDDELTLVAGQEEYDLLDEFPDFVGLLDVRWTTTNTRIREARSHLEYQRIKQAVPTGVPFKYSLENMTMKLIPVPSDDVTDTVTVFYQYRPTDLDTMENYTPPIASIYDRLFVFWCLFTISQTYELDTGRPGQAKSGEFFQLWKQIRQRVLGKNDSSTRRLRYYRM